MAERFEVADDEAGARLDRFLADRFGLSRAQVKRWLEQGAVRVDGQRARKGDTLAAGAEVVVELPFPSACCLADPDVALQVVYEDDALVVVDKPRGQPSHPLAAAERGCLANGLLARFPDMASCGYDPRQPGLVNRLDNDTSGLVLAARAPEAFVRLRGQLSAGQIRKRYIALVLRALEPGAEWVSGLAPDPTLPRRVVAVPGHARRTKIVSCRPRGRYFEVEVDAGPAYRHQVRVHLAEAGAPLVGDLLYGGGSVEGWPSGHWLHACTISLAHPFTGEPVRCASAVPDDWPR